MPGCLSTLCNCRWNKGLEMGQRSKTGGSKTAVKKMQKHCMVEVTAAGSFVEQVLNGVDKDIIETCVEHQFL